MMEFLLQLPTLQKIFFISAVVGGVLFLLLIALQLFGAGSEDFGDMDVSDISFKFLSLQGLTSFLLMFGLSGLAYRREFLFSPLVATVSATLSGLLSVWLIRKLFNLFIGFQSSGNLNFQSAVGQEGSVYLSIPANGTGKVQIVIQGRLRTLDAVSTKHVEIAFGQPVRVVAVTPANVLQVEPC